MYVISYIHFIYARVIEIRKCWIPNSTSVVTKCAEMRCGDNELRDHTTLLTTNAKFEENELFEDTEVILYGTGIAVSKIFLTIFHWKKL